MDLEKAYSNGDAVAAAILGHAYLTGMGLPQNKHLAYHWLQLAFMKDYRPACMDIGRYFLSQGMAYEAVYFLQMAADENDPEARDLIKNIKTQFTDAGMNFDIIEFQNTLFDTEDPFSDPVQSIEKLKAAIATGDSGAAFRLSRIYDLGWGVPMNPQLATKYIETVVELGDRTAIPSLCVRYIFGMVPGKGYREAAELLYTGNMDEWPEIMFNLAQIWSARNGPADVPEDAIKFLIDAAKEGHALSQYDLGMVYFDGSAISKNVAEAVELLKKSAEQNFARAAYQLAMIYGNGLGVAEDRDLSRKYLEQAAGLGDPKAKATLKTQLWSE